MIKIIKAIIEKLKVLSYNEFTIENYFRKKGYKVGKNNRIFIRSLGSEPFLVKIGNHCTLTAGVIFLTHEGACWIFREEIPDLNVFGKIEIKDNCFIGMNSIIHANITIGPNSVVGAGSVVTKDVPPNCVVAGIPAKVICSTEDFKKKCLKRSSNLNLKGNRKNWQTQLTSHFWRNNK